MMEDNNLVSTVILNLFKDSLTLIGLLSVMFYQNWKLSLFAIIMIPIVSCCQNLKRVESNYSTNESLGS